MRTISDDPHRLLLRALREPSDNYRRGTRPADIIVQSMSERDAKKPIRLADLPRKLRRRRSKDQQRSRSFGP